MYKEVKVLNRFSGKIINGRLNVGLGEIGIGESGLSLRVPALGSCIALVIYVRGQPREARIATMAHIVYPTSKHRVNPDKNIISWGKYADIAFFKMIKILTRKGFSKEDLAAKMTGGLLFLNMDSKFQNINELAILKLLKQENIPLMSSYTGGTTPIEAVFKVNEYKMYATPKGAPTIIL